MVHLKNGASAKLSELRMLNLQKCAPNSIWKSNKRCKCVGTPMFCRTASISTSTKRQIEDEDSEESQNDDAPMSSTNPEEEKNSTATVTEETGTISEHTFRVVENNKKKKKKKHHMMPLQHARILLDIPESDEQIIRSLFQKFQNSWSQFQKHPKLSK